MLISLLVFVGGGVLILWSVGLVSWIWSAQVLGFIFRDISFDFLLEDVSMVCLLMLISCGGIALFYCFHYFGGLDEASLLYPLMVWFLGVMGVLVLSGGVLFSLVMWEYLGLVSFFLILFYSNMGSLRASLITLFASRFGDVALFFLVMWLTAWMEYSCFVFFVLVGMVVLSKSACYPFISWLLEAMRAPTPVSSLVHSSTLVAAGVWFFFRYSEVFESGVLCLIFVLSVVTILVSGSCALFFYDLKKLVALSTCNNVSWCLVFFICGDLELALLQLLTHGVCKCYLFMSVGDLMGLSGGSQSSVGVYLSRYTGLLGVYLQFVLISSLCGLPFLGVFFSKHYLLSGVTYVFGLGYMVLLMLCLFLSYAYSFRFILLLLKGLGGLSCGYSSYFILISLLSVLGTFINLVGFGGMVECMVLSSVWSLLILGIQVVGCLGGWWLFMLMGGEGPVLSWSTLFYSDSMVKGIYDSFVSWSMVSCVSFYRWELYLVGLWPRMVDSFLFFRWSFFSFNLLVFLIFLLVFFYLFLGC